MDASEKRTWIAAPNSIVSYLEALRPAGWEMYHGTPDLHVFDVGFGMTLPQVLARIDDTTTKTLVIYLVVGQGKTFSIARWGPVCVEFDSHQRTLTGVPAAKPTCVTHVAATAKDFLPGLSTTYDSSIATPYDLYKVERSREEIHWSQLIYVRSLEGDGNHLRARSVCAAVA